MTVVTLFQCKSVPIENVLAFEKSIAPKTYVIRLFGLVKVWTRVGLAHSGPAVDITDDDVVLCLNKGKLSLALFG